MASVPHGMENVATCQGCACQISVNLTQATIIWEEETSNEKKLPSYGPVYIPLKKMVNVGRLPTLSGTAPELVVLYFIRK